MYDQINLNSEVTLMVELNKIKNEKVKNITPIKVQKFNIELIDDINKSKSTSMHINNKVSSYNCSVEDIRLYQYVADIIQQNSSTFTNINFNKMLPANSVLHTFNFKSTLIDKNESDQEVTYMIKHYSDYLKYISKVFILKSSDEEYFHVVSPLACDIICSVNQLNRKQFEINNLIYFKYKTEDYDQVVKNYLIKLLDTQINRTSVGDSLRELWLYQIQQKNINISEKAIVVNTTIKSIIDNIIQDVSSSANNAYKNSITYRQLFEFFDEVANELITEQTKEAQEWILIDDSNTYINTLLNHQNYNQLDQCIKNITQSNESKNIIEQLYSDSLFKKNHKITAIYQINPAKDNQFDSRKQLIHGSVNNSIMSILLNGLKTNRSLRQNNINHKYTGSGLGEGIYFAKLNECSKSSNYTGSSRSGYHYMVIADVDYDSNNVLTVTNYNSSINNQQYSLIYGHKVGGKGLSEYVAPHDDQVNIRYLVEYK